MPPSKAVIFSVVSSCGRYACTVNGTVANIRMDGPFSGDGVLHIKHIKDSAHQAYLAQGMAKVEIFRLAFAKCPHYLNTFDGGVSGLH